MKYRNVKTGQILELNSIVKDKGWELIPPEEKPSKKKPTKKKVKDNG